ncbi:MAG: sulfotransferase [Rhodospirillaceae bacterium]
MDPELEFQKANDLYRAGDLPGTVKTLASLAEAVPDHPEILHFLSVAQLQSGDSQEASVNLKRITELKPNWAGGFDLYGVALRQSGRLEAAERQLRKAVRLDPDFAQAHYNLGNVYRDQRRYSEAAKSFNKAVLINPDYADAYFNQGEALCNLGRLAEASAAYQSIVQRNPGDVEAVLKLAETLILRNMHHAAQSTLEIASESNPTHPAVLDMLAQVYQRTGNHAAAIGHLDRLIGIVGEQPALLRDKAAALRAQGDVAGAVAIAEHAVGLNPDDADSLFHLAYLLERLNRVDEARETVDRGIAIDGGHSGLALVGARLDRRAGNPQAGIDRLKALSADVMETSPATSEIYFELGMLYEQLDRPGDAIENLTLGNRAMIEDEEFLNRLKGRSSDYLEKIDRAFSALNGQAPAPARQEGKQPIFVIGFPRSGTTLLDQVLDAHPGMQVLEEQPTLSTVRDRLIADSGFPENLFDLSNQQLADMRGVYFAAVDQCIEREPGTRIVDKMPLNIMDAGLINRLFPGAQFILALRHPCDVCLSCFMQPFELNDAMAHFTTLPDTVAFYGRVMDLWRRQRDVLPLDVFEVRYEDLTRDLAPVARGLLEFLGLPWDDAVLDPTGHARSKGYIGTSSYHQVVEQINTRAVNRWRKFELHMTPFLPKLRAHIHGFGYDTGA